MHLRLTKLIFAYIVKKLLLFNYKTKQEADLHKAPAKENNYHEEMQLEWEGKYYSGFYMSKAFIILSFKVSINLRDNPRRQLPSVEDV